MSETAFGPLRLWTGDPPGAAPPLVARLAAEEAMRPTLRLHERFEPLSLAWFQEVERQRYHRHGRWVPRLLGFEKVRGERLLGIGSPLGTDLVNYAQRGAEVLVAGRVAAELGVVRQNFDLRGLPGVFLHASPAALPIESASIDVACVNGVLNGPEADRVVAELYRVLKPGGKLLALVPAEQEAQALVRWLTSFARKRSPAPVANTFDRRGLRQLLGRFHEGRTYRRHLRRGEMPHVCRWLPLPLLERLAGRFYVYKGFKPVSAARTQVAAA